MDENKLSELRGLFKETAALDTEAGRQAFVEFAAALDTPILQEIRLQSSARQLFAVENLEPGALAHYPVADDFDLPVWVLPGLGAVAHNFIEGIGEEVYIPTFTIDTSAEWKLSYAREGRVDIAARAARNMARTIAEYEEESAWMVLVPAGTTNFQGQGLLRPRSAPVYQVTGATGAGYLSKELINKMMVGMKRTDRTLTDLWVSPEDAADIREWTDTDIDPVTRREIFQAEGMGRIWNVQLHELMHLGAVGKMNITSSASDFGLFKASGGNAYQDYTLTHPTVVDSNGQVTTAGETQIWGFDMTVNDSMVMPVKQQWQTFDDPTLHRRQKAGVYGWEEVGFAILDSRCLSLGIIDRYVAP